MVMKFNGVEFKSLYGMMGPKAILRRAFAMIYPCRIRTLLSVFHISFCKPLRGFKNLATLLVALRALHKIIQMQYNPARLYRPHLCLFLLMGIG